MVLRLRIRDRRKHSTATASDRLIASTFEAAVEFTLFTLSRQAILLPPKYQTKEVVDEEGQDEAAEAIPDDSQPHRLLPSTRPVTSCRASTEQLASNNIGEIRA
ncbi:hypothetical protein Bca52824_049415 [Brassica carinata]|uniref:Uncharacterized protein n=1 Tax=Brassica carinata TaxID=52824 RepID=A0A8X7RK98_BRACI|nr:hypothetical protein Bca52824_049415 [Brassica carinata]